MDLSSSAINLFGLFILCVVFIPLIIAILLFQWYRRLSPEVKSQIKLFSSLLNQQTKVNRSTKKVNKSKSNDEKVEPQVVEFEDAEFKEVK